MSNIYLKGMSTNQRPLNQILSRSNRHYDDILNINVSGKKYTVIIKHKKKCI